MVKKLSFLLTDKTWKSLLLKVLFFGLGLFGVYFFDFSFPVIFVFSILVGWFYFSQLPERFHFRISFLVLVLAAVFSLRFFGSSFYLAFLGCLVFSYLFYLLLGLPPSFSEIASLFIFFLIPAFFGNFLAFLRRR